MNQQIETVQKLGKDSFDATVKAFGVASTGTQAIIVDTADYAKKTFEQGTATFEKLVGAKSLDKAIEIQTAYVQDAYKDLVAQTAKTRELYTKLAQDTLAPFGALRPTMEAAITPAKAAPRAK
jgi:hypothetical protein